MLAKLDSKQQALILGHAVPMPVVVQTRPYDQTFYTEVGDLDLDHLSDDHVAEISEAAKLDLGF